MERTKIELLLYLERNIRERYMNRNGNVKMTDVSREIDNAIYHVSKYEDDTRPIEKFMFVEDGSVDTDELIESLAMTNPEIKVVVYRQGGQIPFLVNSDGKAEEAEEAEGGEENEET